MDQSIIKLGLLAPLTHPGWVDAGAHLIGGMELAIRDVNLSGGVGGRPIEAIIRDTGADPQRAITAVDELCHLGVTALAGEFHSVVARAVAERSSGLGLPFLCSSAVIDTLSDAAGDWVARLAPAQSYGWRAYAEFLLNAGHTQIAVAAETSLYWQSGIQILRDHILPRAGRLIELDLTVLQPEVITAQVQHSGATAVLILIGNPSNFALIANAIRGDRRLSQVLIGAPAGQPELDGFAELLEEGAQSIPFLRYLPGTLTALGQRVGSDLQKVLGAPPSFVAFEGYDTVCVLADLMRAHGTTRRAIADHWPDVATEGTRGSIQLTKVNGLNNWQWAWPPIQVACLDRVLYVA